MDYINDKIAAIAEQIDIYKRQGKRLFVTSSFQTHSIPMLSILSEIDCSIPVYFLNTGFHFPSTIKFKRNIEQLLNIQVVDIESNIPKIQQRDHNQEFFFCSRPDYCCHINKILPLEPILIKYDVWITGVRKEQNSNRKSFTTEAKGPFNTTRYHPMLDWTSKMIWEYRQLKKLPEHPLEEQGFYSIGCEPCTSSSINGGRGGRWNGQQKEECGLHTNVKAK